jgi:hypothetical protein
VSSLCVATIDVHDASAEDAQLNAKQVVERAIDADSWGRAGLEAKARVTVTEKSGQRRELAFEAVSRRHSPPLSKSLLRFTAPADVSGMKFLLVQKSDGDDERTLYVPELKRSRRIAGGNRAERFMGTDFNYADMDRRDVRTGDPALQADENIGKYPCYHASVAVKEADSPYKRVEIWVRKDNLIPLKWVMFDKGGTPVKTLVARELQKHGGKWQITRSLMTDASSGRTTEVLIERMDDHEVSPEVFSVANLEKP